MTQLNKMNSDIHTSLDYGKLHVTDIYKRRRQTIIIKFQKSVISFIKILFLLTICIEYEREN